MPITKDGQVSRGKKDGHHLIQKTALGFSYILYATYFPLGRTIQKTMVG